MGVVYDVRQDGTVDVEVTLDWRFGSSDARGIFFTIMTAEPWDDDPGMQAVYRVENIDVSSPTGAADQFTTEEMTHASGHSETLLRIGDPNESVPSTEQTYVISYSLGDGIHEYDGVPEFHHDVTSRDFPRSVNSISPSTRKQATSQGLDAYRARKNARRPSRPAPPSCRAARSREVRFSQPSQNSQLHSRARNRTCSPSRNQLRTKRAAGAPRRLTLRRESSRRG